MINDDINLLPDKVIESLHQGKKKREQLYFLLAIGISLLVLTGLAGGTLLLLRHATTQAHALQEDQVARLERLNSFWNEVLILSRSSTFIEPVQANDEELRKTWEGVTENLQGVTLVSFARQSQHLYRVEAEATDAQESTRFLQDLRQAIPAQIDLDTIRQIEDRVFFTYLIEYPS
jgi:Tfp pilus assembly protein PilN